MMPSKIHQLGSTIIVICSIGLAVLLFYLAYCMCKRYATIDPDSDEEQDYIEQPSSAIFKESVCFSSSNCYFHRNKLFFLHDHNCFIFVIVSLAIFHSFIISVLQNYCLRFMFIVFYTV